MTKTIGMLCVGIASCLDTLSQFRQIGKTLHVRNSSQVSSTAYLYKIVKVAFSIAGLALYANWVGLGMECWMLLVYITVLSIVAKYKPRGWRLFDR